MTLLSGIILLAWPGQDVGCKRDALAAFQGDLRHLSGGFMRTVYVNAKRTVVYTLSKRTDYPAANGDNESEYEMMLALWKNHRMGRYATPCSLYYVEGVAVLAMVYRPVESTAVARNARWEFQQRVAEWNSEHRGDLYIGDMHDANYRATSCKRVKAIDLGRVRW